MAGKPSGYKNQPTHWPTAPFILIKFFQTICCLIVLMIMIFFGYHLRRDGYSIPWQFILLTGLVRSKSHPILFYSTQFSSPRLLYRLMLAYQ